MANDIVYTFEFIGSDLEVLESNHDGFREVKGKVTGETQQTFLVESEGREKTLPKKGNHFKLTMDGRDNILEGNKLICRPEDRIKKLG